MERARDCRCQLSTELENTMSQWQSIDGHKTGMIQRIKTSDNRSGVNGAILIMTQEQRGLYT